MANHPRENTGGPQAKPAVNIQDVKGRARCLAVLSRHQFTAENHDESGEFVASVELLPERFSGAE